jgi:alkylated DNA repair dioxygenase AlkB
LESRSLLILTCDARYKWKHGIALRKSDNGVKRQRRISLTFRKVIL